MKIRKPRPRSVLALMLIVAGVYLVNLALGWPMAWRAGDWREAAGRGPAGPPMRLYKRLLDEKPVFQDTPWQGRAVEALESEGCLVTNTPYRPSATLGQDRLWWTSRPVLPAAAPSRVAYRMEVPSAAALDLGYGVKRFINGRVQRGARFIVEWRGRSGVHRLFQQEVEHGPPGFWEKTRTRRRVLNNYLLAGFNKWGDSFREAHIDLSAHAGEKGELWLIIEPLASTPGAGEEEFSPAMWAAPELWGVSEEEVRPTNVVLFMVEATPVSVVQPYTRRPAVTPHIKSFAQEAAVFDNYFTAGASTNLSVISYFTGIHHAAMDLPDEMYFLAPVVKSRFYRNNYPTLPEAFSRAGYKTAQFGTNHYIMPTRQFGLDLGFDQIDVADRRYYESEDTMLAALAWLRANAGKPLFLYIHFDAPHDEEKPCLEHLAAALGASSPDSRWRYRKYMAQLISADKWFGRLMETLEDLGIKRNTLVVLTADHGNCLDPAHEFAVLRTDRRPWRTPFQHGRAMRTEDFHVPLIIRQPGAEGGHRRIETPVSSLDLFPTLVELALAGLPPDLARRMERVQGKSLVPLMAGSGDDERSHALKGRIIYSVSSGGDSAIVDGRYHYLVRKPGFRKILYPGRERLVVVKEGLYDLARDPRELTDLSGSRPELLERMRRARELARPRCSLVRFLYFNYPGSEVRCFLGMKAAPSLVMTYPREAKPIELMKKGEGAGSRAPEGEDDSVEFFFETELSRPSGLILDAPVEWVELWVDGDCQGPGSVRTGPFGLSLLQEAGCYGEDGRLVLEGCTALPGPQTMAARHPMRYSEGRGLYFYRMGFEDFVEESFSDKSLSPAVRSVLKRWGYIE